MAAYIASIKRVVSHHFGLPEYEMTSHRRSRRIARPRQIAMALAYELTPLSLPAIGRHFGNRDHSTVIHARRIVADLLENDPAFHANYHDLKTACMARGLAAE